MGNVQSVDPRHARIWTHLAALQSNDARAQMLETLLSGPEYVNAAKRVGVYSSVLTWLAAHRRGDRPRWPGSPAPPAAAAHGHSSTALSTVPPPKRALDAIHEAYRVLGIDDTRPLTHEALKAYYRKASVHAHPDRGGSAEKFNEITKSFLYLEEVLNKLSPRATAAAEEPLFSPPPRMVVEDRYTTELVQAPPKGAVVTHVPSPRQPPVAAPPVAPAAPPPPTATGYVVTEPGNDPPGLANGLADHAAGLATDSLYPPAPAAPP